MLSSVRVISASGLGKLLSSASSKDMHISRRFIFIQNLCLINSRSVAAFCFPPFCVRGIILSSFLLSKQAPISLKRFQPLSTTPKVKDAFTAIQETNVRNPTSNSKNGRPSYRARFFNLIHSDPTFAKSTFRGRFIASPNSCISDELNSMLRIFSLDADSQKFKNAENLSEFLQNQSINQQQFNKDSCRLLPSLDTDSALILADIWYQISESNNRVPVFHREFLTKLKSCTDLRPNQVLQSLLYCAVYRRSSPDLEKLAMQIILDNSNSLSSAHLELLAFAAYLLKMDFRSQNAFLCQVAEALLQFQPTNQNQSPNQLAPFCVTLLKFLRQNEFNQVDYFRRISLKLSEYPLDDTNGVESCHILQSFAFATFGDENLARKLEKVILENIRSQLGLYSSPTQDILQLHPSQRLRGKDVANYLNAMSILNFQIPDPELIFEDLRNRRKVLEFLDAPHLLIQSLYALSLQGFYDLGLLTGVFSSVTIRKLFQAGWKDAQRWLYSLYRNCQLEFPEIDSCVNVDVEKLAGGLPAEFDKVGFEMSKRNKEIIEILRKSLEKIYGPEAVAWTRLLPHLEICGFEIKSISSASIIEALKSGGKGNLRNSSGIALELLDDWTCLRNDHSELLGQTATKIRMLRKLGYSVKTIEASSVERCLQTENPVQAVIDLLGHLKLK